MVASSLIRDVLSGSSKPLRGHSREDESLRAGIEHPIIAAPMGPT
jgi:hypothetical protein